MSGWDFNYYKGVLDGYTREVQALGEAFCSFGGGRLGQWKMAVRRIEKTETALEEIREIADGREDGAPDASPEEKAWMRVLVACERALNR